MTDGRSQQSNCLKRLTTTREHAEQSRIAISLCDIARDGQAGLERRIALINSPLPLRWGEVEYLDFKQALVELFGHQLPCTWGKRLSSLELRHGSPRPKRDSLMGVCVRARCVPPSP